MNSIQLGSIAVGRSTRESATGYAPRPCSDSFASAAAAALSLGGRVLAPPLLAVLFVVSVAAASACGAPLYSWQGVVGSPGDYRWSKAGNWAEGTAPPVTGGSDITLLFDGAPPGLEAVNDLDKFSLHQLQFGSTAGAFIVRGDTPQNLLIFEPHAGATPKLLNDSSSTMSLTLEVAFLDSLEVGAVGAGAIELSGPLTGRGVLTKSGPGILTLNSPTADVKLEQLLVSGGVLNIAGGTQVLANQSPAALTFSTVNGGATINITGAGSKLVAAFTSEITGSTSGQVNVLNGGRLETYSPNNRSWWGRTGQPRTILVDGIGSTWESTSSGNDIIRLRGAGSTATISNGGQFTTPGRLAVDLGAQLILHSGGKARIGGLESTLPAEVQISDGPGGESALTIDGSTITTGASAFEYSGSIIDGPTGPGSVTIDGLTTDQSFTNPVNTYSGGTRLLGGRLYVAQEGSLGIGDVLLNGGALFFMNSTTLQRDLSFGPNGGTLGAISGATLTIDQTLHLTSPLGVDELGTVQLTGANQYDALHVANATLELTSDADATVAGKLTGLAGTLAKRGAGVLTLTQPIDEVTAEKGRAIVRVHEGAVRLTDPLAMNGNVFDLQKNDGVILDVGPIPLNILAEEVRGWGNLDLGAHSLVLGRHVGPASFYTGTISGTGSVTVLSGAKLLGVNAYAGGTIFTGGELTIVPGTTVGDIDGRNPAGFFPLSLILQQDVDGAYSGNILGQFPIRKRGAGALTLVTTSDHNKTFFVEEGTLALPAAPNGYFSHNTFTLSGGTTVRTLSDGNFSVLDLRDDATIDTNGHRVTADFLLGGTISQATIAKAGTGVLSLANAEAHAISVLGGTLEIVGNGVSIASATIAEQGSLAGIGSGPAQVLLQSGGTLAPGLDSQPIGVLSVSSLLWDEGAVLEFELAGGALADVLELSGAFDKGATGASGFRFDFTGSNPVDGGRYLLTTFGSTNFDVSDFSYVGLAPWAWGVFQLESNALYFQTSVVPEPTALALMANAAFALTLRRRG